MPLLPKHKDRRGGTDASSKLKEDAESLVDSKKPSPVTRVNPASFVLPVKRLGVSGGTAPFFQLKLKNPDEEEKSVDYYIGKDLSHARDEIDFYEKMLLLKRDPGENEDLLPLLEFAFEYAGVLSTSEEGFPEIEAPLELLVLKNLSGGMKRLRLLDLKIGQKTAQSGWQGKTRLRATKQGVLDALTNSTTEGFRLEGFDGCPGALASKEPLLDAIPGSLSNSKLAGSLSPGEGTKKKVNRMMLQHMKGRDIFRHFVDLHLDFSRPAGAGEERRECYDPIEYGELVLNEVVERLAKLFLACCKAPVPQKWVGSSVALGYDAGYLPIRGAGTEEEIRSGVLVNVFDWGRSELNTVEAYNAMDEAGKADRRRFWKFYSDGIRNLSWNAAQEYWNRYCNVCSWEEVHICVIDYDSTSKDDFMCQATVPVVETKKTLIPLKGRIVKLKVKGTLSYSFEWHDAPSQDSRLRGWFRLYIGEGKDLPIKDKAKGGKSDPYCVITAKSSCGKHEFSQMSSVITQNINPQWDEFFDFPIARNDKQSAKALERGCGCARLSSTYGSWLNSHLGADSSGPEEWGDMLKATEQSQI